MFGLVFLSGVGIVLHYLVVRFIFFLAKLFGPWPGGMREAIE